MRKCYAEPTGLCARHARRPGASVGVTLVEILVVVAVAGILMGLFVPMAVHSRATARMVICAHNLRGLGEAYSICLTELDGYFPDAYYAFESSEGTCQVEFRAPAHATPDLLFRYAYSESLICPCDDTPAQVLARTALGLAGSVPSSYAYNVGLPLTYQNASRVEGPVNTVTFYDGVPSVVVGEWQPSTDWADGTAAFRHGSLANFLFLDGHVEPRGNLPFMAVEGIRECSETASAPRINVNINPGNSPSVEFCLTLEGGYKITRDDLKADDPLNYPCGSFSSDYLEYVGPAVSVRLKPSAFGTESTINLEGKLYTLKCTRTYLISARSEPLAVHLYNKERTGGKAPMGGWWIDITAPDATITVLY